MYLFFILSIFYCAYSQDTVSNVRCNAATEITMTKSTIYHTSLTGDNVRSMLEIPKDNTTSVEWVTALYYKLTPTEEGNYFVSTCGERTTLQTTIYLFETCEGVTGKKVTVTSEAGATCQGSGKAATKFTAVANQAVYIAVVVPDGSQGTVVVNVVKETIQPNTDCPSAYQIESIPFTDISEEIGNYPNMNLQCLSSKMSGKWYYLPGDDNFYLVDTCSSYTAADTYIVMLNNITHNEQGTCVGAYCTNINDDGCGKGNHGSAMMFKAEKGKDYHLGVVGKLGENGRYQLNVQTLDNTLPMSCQNAQQISIPFSMTQQMPAVWAPSTVLSDGGNYKVFYFSVVGTGNEVIIGTCPSKSTIAGTGVEVVEACSATEAMKPTYSGTCGMDEYKCITLKKERNILLNIMLKETKKVCQ